MWPLILRLVTWINAQQKLVTCEIIIFLYVIQPSIYCSLIDIVVAYISDCILVSVRNRDIGRSWSLPLRVLNYKQSDSPFVSLPPVPTGEEVISSICISQVIIVKSLPGKFPLSSNVCPDKFAVNGNSLALLRNQ